MLLVGSLCLEDRKSGTQTRRWLVPTQSNGLSVIGQQLAQQDWSKLPSGMRDKIQGLMDKTESSQQKHSLRQNKTQKQKPYLQKSQKRYSRRLMTFCAKDLAMNNTAWTPCKPARELPIN